MLSRCPGVVAPEDPRGPIGVCTTGARPAGARCQPPAGAAAARPCRGPRALPARPWGSPDDPQGPMAEPEAGQHGREQRATGAMARRARPPLALDRPRARAGASSSNEADGTRPGRAAARRARPGGGERPQVTGGEAGGHAGAHAGSPRANARAPGRIQRGKQAGAERRAPARLEASRLRRIAPPRDADAAGPSDAGPTGRERALCARGNGGKEARVRATTARREAERAQCAPEKQDSARSATNDMINGALCDAAL